MLISNLIEVARSKSRRADKVLIRIAIAKILREEGFAFRLIGEFLGNRDHSTIMFYINTHEIYVETNYRPYFATFEFVAERQQQIVELMLNFAIEEAA